MVTKNKKRSYTLSDETVQMLEELALWNDRYKTNMIEILIKAAHKIMESQKLSN